MKVLVRRLNDELYAWKDAEYIAGGIKVGSTFIQETDIVSILDDDRNKYVRCSSCGATILNTPEEIEKHRKRYLDHNTCLTCAHLQEERARDRKYEYTLTSGDTYIRHDTITVDLKCSFRGWYNRSYISSEEARNNCRFKRCETAEMNTVSDIFTEHPGVFDDIITSDKIITNGYKSRESMRRGYTSYRLNGRNQIFAMVNDLNIVDHFIVAYHNTEWRLYYSKLTNELYCETNYTYKPWRPSEMSNSTREYIKKKIAELYA